MNLQDWQELLNNRRTIRLFTQDTVTRPQLECLLDAARMASCGANLQRLRYTVVTSKALVDAILPHTAWAALVKPRRTPQLHVSAPTAWIAVHASAELASNPIIHADAGAAIQSMELAAAVQGLGCCWLASVDKEEVGKLIGLPADRKILYAVAVGHPAETPCSENVANPAQISYYLDSQDRLHVPKLSVDALTEWR